MRHYRATNRATGEVVEYDSSTPQAQHLEADWSVEDVEPCAVAAEDAALPAPAVKITKLAFRNRFTTPEKVAIEMAALDDPSAGMPNRQFAAALRAQLADQRDATHIDLSRPDVRAGLRSLELAGLIAVGRAKEIAETPSAQNEAWNGD